MTTGVEERLWHMGDVEEHLWRELGRQEAIMALAVAAGALAQVGRSRDDVLVVARKKAALARDGVEVFQCEECLWALVGP